ncbi:MAG: type II secretion system F family protein, partial [Actinomycetota bacterium]
MKLLARIAVTSAALSALVLPTLALGQGAAPTLAEAPNSGFPDRAYLLQLPSRKALTPAGVDVTENGGAVTGVAIVPPGGKSTGAVLLIDASNSMKGAPLQGAMVAARAFLTQRKLDMPVSVIVFGPDDSTLASFTTDKATLAAAVAKTPPTAEGTHIYDALIEASKSIEAQGLERATIVLLSDGTDFGSDASRAEALAALDDANVRVISVGLKSPQYDPQTLRAVSQRSGGKYAEAAKPAELAAIFSDIGADLASEYELTYRSLLPPNVPANVKVAVAGLPAATAAYTTPAIDFAARGTFERSWIDKVIISPWLMVFILISVLALIAFAFLTAVDVRHRSLRRRMALYVTVPTEEESRLRRAEVATMLADTAQKTIGGQKWWQRFESDVELGAFRLSALAIAGWTIVGGILASLVAAIVLQSLWALLLGLAAPLVTRFVVSHRVSKKRKDFETQLPDNIDVLAGAMRTGHSTMGALSVMVDSADEPSKSEFRRVLQDEQLGVPLDDAIMVTSRRMQSQDAGQIALVMRLQREAGGNTAEVLDRVAEVIRGRMEIRRLVDVLTAQARMSRWILIGLPIFVLLALVFTGGDFLQPMFDSLVGRAALV